MAFFLMSSYFSVVAALSFRWMSTLQVPAIYYIEKPVDRFGSRSQMLSWDVELLSTVKPGSVAVR